jgi:hypothetical protein
VPLLKRGSEVFPQDLLERCEADLPWVVAHTRSRQEKALVRRLESLGIAFYLPQREQRLVRAGRALVSFLPLFPGYVFLRATAPQRAAALRSPAIVRLFDVRDQELLNRELRELRSFHTGPSLLATWCRWWTAPSVDTRAGSFVSSRGSVSLSRSRC